MDKLKRNTQLMALSMLAVMMWVSGAGCVRSLNDDSAYASLPASGWVYGEVVNLDLTHADSVSQGELTVAISHDSSYLYSNLWLELSHDAGDKIVCDTVEFQLSDSTGNWLGRGLSPSIELEIPVGHLSHVSGSRIGVRHIMRCDTLRGISKVGLFFKSDNENGSEE